jgi:hypothetical protein
MSTPASAVAPRDLLTRLDDALMWTGVRRLVGQELAENEDPACQFWISAREIGGRLCLSASFTVRAGVTTGAHSLPEVPTENYLLNLKNQIATIAAAVDQVVNITAYLGGPFVVATSSPAYKFNIADVDFSS